MAHHGRVRRNTSRRRPYAWLGAGAVGVGLALAGAVDMTTALYIIGATH